MAAATKSSGVIWDDLLNDNYETLLDDSTTSRPPKRARCSAPGSPIATPPANSTDDKIQGSMAGTMNAACVTRETARRAMLLAFFARL